MKEGSADVNKFLDVLTSNAFFPTINLPTRMTNHSETLIDNIFTNTQKYLIQSGNIISGISDHLPQFAIFETNKTNERTVKQLRNWHSLNEPAFIEDFEKIKWKEILKLECLDPDLSFETFITTINHLIEKHIPLKTISKRKLTSKPWITNIQKSISQRDRLLKRVIKEKDQTKKDFLFNKYKETRNQIVCQIRESKRLHFQQ